MNATAQTVDTAVQNALLDVAGNLNADAIPSEARKITAKAFNAAFDAYHKKGGIGDQKAALEANVERFYAAQVLLIINQAVSVAENNLPLAHMVAEELFNYGEEQLKSRHTDPQTGKNPPIAEMLPGYPNYKSRGLLSLQSGRNPQQKDADSGELLYPTLGKFTKGVQPKGSNKRKDGKDGDGKATVLEVVTSHFSPELRAVVKGLTTALHDAPTPLHPELVKLVTAWANTVAGMVSDFHKAEAERAMPPKQVATATTGNPEADAAAAAEIAAQKATETPADKKERAKRGGKRV